MKLDRMLGIVTLLLQKGKLTAPYLAERFEVSRRTIQRDIEDICKAGIPLITAQGYQGGISISEGYQLDKSVLTEKERQELIQALLMFSKIPGFQENQGLMNKFSLLSRPPDPQDIISLDLGSYHQESLSQKIGLIKEAVSSRKKIAFDYYSPKGMTHRTAEPYQIHYKWSSWYLSAYCELRGDFRHFKLNRLWGLSVTGEGYTPRTLPEGISQPKEYGVLCGEEQKLILLFDESAKYRLIEEYGPDCYTTQPDGRLLFQIDYGNEDYMLGWILGFGDKAEVLGPPWLREKAAGIIRRLYRIYQEPGEGHGGENS